MVMTPRQMLAFGEMYRNGGHVNGRQILSKAFIEDTFEPRGRSRISGREYGYGWWMRDMAGRKAFYAWGFGGQYIVLVPSLDLTVVSTSAATVSEDRRDHRRTVDEIIEQLIVGALGGQVAGAGLKSCATVDSPGLLISALFRCATICDSSIGAVWP